MISPTATAAALADMPLTFPPALAASYFGISRPGVYDAIRRGDFPLPTFVIGARRYCRLSDLAEALGIPLTEVLAIQAGGERL